MSVPRPCCLTTRESRKRRLSISDSRSLCDIEQLSSSLWQERLTGAPSSMYNEVAADVPQSQSLAGQNLSLQHSPTSQFQDKVRGTSHDEPIGQRSEHSFEMCDASPQLPPISCSQDLTARTASFQVMKGDDNRQFASR